MFQTKHALAFFIVLAILSAGYVIYLLLFQGGNNNTTEEQGDAQFVEDEQDYEVVTGSAEADREAAREAIIARLSEYERERPEATEAEPETDETADSEAPTDAERSATSSESSNAALPATSIQVGSTVVAGTPGSYCWDGVCETTLVTDLPYSAHAVTASGTLPYIIEAPEPPAAVFVFWKAVNAATTTTMRQLSPSEVSEKQIVLPDVEGEYLLFITGQWLGGNEASNVFKLLMM